MQTNLFVTSTDVSLSYENRTYPINTTCGQNAEIWKFKARGYIRQPFFLNICYSCYDRQPYARQIIKEPFIHVTYGEYIKINSQAYLHRPYAYKSILCCICNLNSHPHYDYFSCLKSCSNIEYSFFSHVQTNADIHSAFFKTGATDLE
jgi:hypothetical protein